MKKIVFVLLIAIALPVAVAPFSTSAQLTRGEIRSIISELFAEATRLQELLDEDRVERPGARIGYTFNTNLSLGDRSEDVRQLQIVLNQDPTTQVAPTGAGSPGNETTYFGPRTRAAVIKFQNEYADDVLSQVRAISGTGYVGPATRDKLNELTTVSEDDSDLEVDVRDEDDSDLEVDVGTAIQEKMTEIKNQADEYYDEFGDYMFLTTAHDFIGRSIDGEEFTREHATRGVAFYLEELNDLAPTDYRPDQYLAIDDADQNWVMVSQLPGTTREWCVDNSGDSTYVAAHSFNEMRLQESRATQGGPLDEYECDDFVEKEERGDVAVIEVHSPTAAEVFNVGDVLDVEWSNDHGYDSFSIFLDNRKFVNKTKGGSSILIGETKDVELDIELTESHYQNFVGYIEEGYTSGYTIDEDFDDDFFISIHANDETDRTNNQRTTSKFFTFHGSAERDYETGTIDLFSPSGGETWEIGGTYDIEWASSSGVERVMIDLVDVNGKMIYNEGIDLPMDNVKTYSWTIPSDIPTGEYKIQVSSCPEGLSRLYCLNSNLDQYGYDVSSRYFSIADPDDIQIQEKMTEIKNQADEYYDEFGDYMFLTTAHDFIGRSVNGHEFTREHATRGVAYYLEQLNDLAPTDYSPSQYLAIDDADQNWVMVSQLHNTDRDWCVDSGGDSTYVAAHSFNEMRLQESRATRTGPLDNYNCGDFDEPDETAQSVLDQEGQLANTIGSITGLLDKLSDYFSR